VGCRLFSILEPESSSHSEALSALHALCDSIGRQLAQTDDAVRHIERVVGSGPPDELIALQTLCANIDKRLAQVEDAVRRIESLAARPAGAPTDRRTVARASARRFVSDANDRQSTQPARQQSLAVAAGIVVLAAVLIVIAPTRVPIGVPVPPVPRAQPQPALPAVERLPAPAQTSPVELPVSTTASTLLLPPDALVPPPRRPPVAQEVVATPATPTRFVGDLSIASTPSGARVSLNGRAAGVTPLVLREQRAGSVAVQIANEGFERWSASVQIRAGEVSRVAATLRASRPQ